MLQASVLLLALVLSYPSVAKANPYLYDKQVSPPSDVKPPTTFVYPPINNTVYATNTVSLTINVSIPETEATAKYSLHLRYIRYQTDWKDSFFSVYEYPPGTGLWITDFLYNMTLAEIPEGSHNVTFVTIVDGGYGDGATFCWFNLESNSTIYFVVDLTSPSVSILSNENETCLTSDVPLNFAVNEPVAEISYSLDGKDNVTIAGNTTLTGLSVGVHNVKVFVWDPAGNVGASEIATFSLAEPEPKPFPTTPALIIVVVGVVLAGAGFLLIRKRVRGKTQ